MRRFKIQTGNMGPPPPPRQGLKGVMHKISNKHVTYTKYYCLNKCTWPTSITENYWALNLIPHFHIFPCNDKHFLTEPEGNSFKFCLPRETLRFETNKINCFPRDQSSSELLYSWKCWSWKFIKPCCNSSCGQHLWVLEHYCPLTS